MRAALPPAGIAAVDILMRQPCQAATAVLAEVACQLNDLEFATRLMSCEHGNRVATTSTRSAASGRCSGGVPLEHALLQGPGFTSRCLRPSLLQRGGSTSRPGFWQTRWRVSALALAGRTAARLGDHRPAQEGGGCHAAGAVPRSRWDPCLRHVATRLQLLVPGMLHFAAALCHCQQTEG